MNSKKKMIFVGLNGYEMPYTRVRCYHFADMMKSYGIDASVLSYRQDLAPQYDHIEMLELGDIDKLIISGKALFRLLKEKDALFYIQKVHYHTAIPFFLSNINKSKFVLDYDDWDFDRSPFFRNKNINKIFFGACDPKTITKNVISKADKCIVSSKYLYKFIKDINEKVFYIPTGVNTNVFKRQQLKSQDERIVFVWCGQVWGKIIYDNLLYLIRSFERVSREHKNVKFLIIGSGSDIPKLKLKIKNEYNTLDIEITDWVHPLDMPKYLSRAHIGLLPLVPDKDNEEWMRSKSPTKLFEYMAMGLPTVASRFGEAEFIIEDGKDGFLAHDENEFFDKMSLLVKNAELRNKMGNLARKKVEENYSLDVLGAELFKALESKS
jgi:glycosyltransferase involved in cell wall biosynthesis